MAAQTRVVFDGSLTAMSRLASLVLLGADAELTLAFSIVQSRTIASKSRADSAELIPLFDMLNHAQDNTCTFCHVSVEMSAEIRSMMATEVG
jgi:hypothetical protein